jgi:hypothetical protein
MLCNAAARPGQRADPVFLPMGRNDIADYLGSPRTREPSLDAAQDARCEPGGEKHICLLMSESLPDIAGSFQRRHWQALAPIPSVPGYDGAH